MVKHWEQKAEAMLVGRKIVKVRYLSEDERKSLGWDGKCLVIQLDDGNIIYPSSDNEGNNAGSLFTNDLKITKFPVV